MYSILWTGESYGVDQASLFLYFGASDRGSYPRYSLTDEWEMRLYINRQRSSDNFLSRIEKPFLSLNNDIYKDRVGYMNLNFFDAVNDSFLQMEGHKISV